MNARGMKEFYKYELGAKLTLKQSILAKCCECMGKYADGKVDCGIEECPLYPFMVYGAMYRGREKRIISPLQAETMRQRLKRVSRIEGGGHVPEIQTLAD
jgi:hypothetical protein